jgi:hypothetical protein
MNRPFLPVAIAMIALVSACSGEKADNAAEARGDATPAANAAVESPAEAEAPAAAFHSSVASVQLNPVNALPKAPASAASREECGAVDAKSPAAQQVAKAGWGVTGEGKLGSYQLVSFAGQFEPGTSGSCQVGKGNVAVFDGEQIVAIAYVPSGKSQSIGRIAPFGQGGLRIWDGDVVPAPLADFTLEGTQLAVAPPARREQVCGGKAVVPGIYGAPIGKARARLIAAGWEPVNHGAAADRTDSREQELAEKGVTEVESCSGTGFGFCAFDYKRAGATLSVITVGDGEDPGVSDYRTRCGG